MTATDFCFVVLMIWLAQASAEDKPFLNRMAKVWAVFATLSFAVDIARMAIARWS
jgi:hypothetical protein